MPLAGSFTVEERKTEDGVLFAARCLPLGLTAYRKTEEASVARLKQMFDFWVDVRYKQMGYRMC